MFYTKRTRNIQNYFEKNKVRGLNPLELKTYLKATLLKSVGLP